MDHRTILLEIPGTARRSHLAQALGQELHRHHSSLHLAERNIVFIAPLVKTFHVNVPFIQRVIRNPGDILVCRSGATEDVAHLASRLNGFKDKGALIPTEEIAPAAQRLLVVHPPGRLYVVAQKPLDEQHGWCEEFCTLFSLTIRLVFEQTEHDLPLRPPVRMGRCYREGLFRRRSNR